MHHDYSCFMVAIRWPSRMSRNCLAVRTSHLLVNPGHYFDIHWYEKFADAVVEEGLAFPEELFFLAHTIPSVNLVNLDVGVCVQPPRREPGTQTHPAHNRNVERHQLNF